MLHTSDVSLGWCNGWWVVQNHRLDTKAHLHDIVHEQMEPLCFHIIEYDPSAQVLILGLVVPSGCCLKTTTVVCSVSLSSGRLSTTSSTRPEKTSKWLGFTCVIRIWKCNQNIFYLTFNYIISFHFLPFFFFEYWWFSMNDVYLSCGKSTTD